MKLMKKQLLELLDIYAPSGKETPVREYLQPLLKELMDAVYVDKYGNLLAFKKVGTGQGASVLLSAHMDTVRGVQPDKKVVDKDSIITAVLPNGERTVLGADDRAGIAIILTVLRNIPESFNGEIRVAFSREEEIGCIGAENIHKSFYRGVDLAIVIDRKGNRDIVVGCDMAFCSNAVGYFMEEVSKVANMNYKCVEGGISDALVFSNNHINSINLSAGYYGEHTKNEMVSLAFMKDTATLVVQSLALINNFYQGFTDVPVSNEWVIHRKNPFKNESIDYAYEIGDDEYLEIDDSGNGDIYAYGFGGKLVISQGENEIILDALALEDLYKHFANSAEKIFY